MRHMITPMFGNEPGATLEQLVETLGPAVLRVLTTPGLGSVSIGEMVVYDPVDPPFLRKGDVLLGVGLLADAQRAREVVQAARNARAAAVVIKPHGADLTLLRETAEQAEVTLIALPAGMRWEHISALLRHAMATAGATATGLSQVGDLFGFANLLAGVVGGAVTIEDANSQVLAYSTLLDDELDEPRREVILQRRVPEPSLKLLREGGVFRDLYASTEVVRIEPDVPSGRRRRLAIAVRADDEVLATLWVLEGHQPLRADAERGLRDAARVAAAHLIRARSDGYVLWQRREDMLKELLEGRAEARMAVQLLGFDPGRPAVVVGIALTSNATFSADQRAYRRLDELLSARAIAFRCHVASVVCGARMLALLPELGSEPEQVRASVRRIAEAFASDAAQVGIGVRVACGPVVPSLNDVAGSRAAADQVLQVLADEPGRGPVADEKDVRAAVALHEVLEVLAPMTHLWQGPVEVLGAHDAQHGTDYQQTLRAWLDEFGDTVRAAQRLNVHPNTIRYRIQRITHLSGIRLDDPADRLLAALHLRQR